MTSTFGATFSALRRLLRYLRPPPLPTAVSVLLLLAAGGLEGATVGLLVPLLGLVTSSGAGTAELVPGLSGVLGRLEPRNRVIVLGVGIVLMVALKNVLSILGNVSSGRLRSRALVELRRQLLERVMTAPPVTLEQHASGAIIDLFLSKAFRVNRMLEACVVLIQRSVIVLSYFAVMLALSWRFTLATLGLGVVIALTAQRLGARVLQQGRVLSEASTRLGRQVGEVIGGLKVIRTTATEDTFAEVFSAPNRDHAYADTASGVALTIQQGAIETLGVAGAIVLTGLAHMLWLAQGTLDVPRFLAFGFGLVRLLPALNVVYATQGGITSGIGAVEHLLNWLELPRYPTRPFGTQVVPSLREGIRFENVSFTYPDGHEPIRGLSFFLPAGETLAVLGASGAGKSTLAALFLRLREPTAGRVLLDGIDHRDFAPASFHAAVGYVDQESFLFNASIVDNVIAGRPAVSREAALRALWLVQLGDLVERLPQGPDTVVAERGSTISGGQRQRLAIARAIAADPQVLVLDEPTSSLDSETEREVVKAIDAASAGRTTIIITHRATTARHATQRLDLSTGEVTAATVLGAARDEERVAG